MKRLVKSAEHNMLIATMLEAVDRQSDGCVGPFWYDPESNELFGIVSTLSSDLTYREQSNWNCMVRTAGQLHSAIWDREQKRGKDSRFNGDYKQIPRGRVFEFKDEGFVVFTGHWIDKYPQAKQQIIEEFSLPENTQFRKDIHWEIGHGLENEF